MSTTHVMKGWQLRTPAIYGSEKLIVSHGQGERIRQYLIHAICITLFWTFRLEEDSISGCGSGFECHWVEVEAMATISSLTSTGRYFMNVERESHNHTLLCRLGLFGLDISRACPSLFYSTRPCCRCREWLKLFWIKFDMSGQRTIR